MMQELTNWGGYPRKACDIIEPATYEQAADAIRHHRSLIARGNGRCYGDASLAPTVILTRQFKQVISFDEEHGTIYCQSGVLLSTILELVVPKGFFLPVSPGTKFITAGGAFASDIHGKNHHVDGVFSDHVSFIRLINAGGEIVEARPGEELFNQTAGGMGATGLIIELCFSLKRIETAYIRQTAIRAKDLDTVFRLFEQHGDATYSVAWIDCLAMGRHTGRSVLLLGEHAKEEEVRGGNKWKLHGRQVLNIPFYFPSWFLHFSFVRVFNWLYYMRPGAEARDRIMHYDAYFYPLDAIGNWNRIYGKKGFVQYQFVIPKAHSYETVRTILQALAHHKMSSFLAVLKLFGKSHEHRYLHFPMEGYTLALDIAVSAKIWPVLDQLDEIVTKAGGKVYLSKDARMRKEHYRQQYVQPVPHNNSFNSYQMQRLESVQKNVFLVLGANSDIARQAAISFVKTQKEPYLILASRDTEAIASFIKEQQWEGIAEACYFDAAATGSHEAFVGSLSYKPRWVLYAGGRLITNEEAIGNTDAWLDAVKVNYTGAVSVLNALLHAAPGNNLERIIGISSVAGLRGRKANYMYGSLKSGFHAYLFGLRQALKERGVLVQAATPGFVKTKMTRHLNTPGNAVEAVQVAKSIVLDKSGRFELYPNLYWRMIGSLVKVLPEFIIAKI